MQLQDSEGSIDLRISLTILRLLGLWPQPDSCPLYHCYTAWVLLMLTSKIFTQAGVIIKFWGDLQSITMILCLMLTFMAGIFKVSTFLLMRGRLDSLLERLNSSNLLYASMQRTRQAAIFHATARRSTAMSTSFLGLGGLALLLFVLHPVLKSYMQEPSTNSTIERSLPSVAWYPFDHTQSPYYEGAYLYQVITLSLIYITTSTLDTFYVTIIIFIAGHLKILNSSLSHITEDVFNEIQSQTSEPRSIESMSAYVLEESGSLQNLNKAKNRLTECCRKILKPGATDTEIHHYLMRCVHHHQSIIRSIEELEFVMSPAVLAQFMTSMIVICLTAFVVTVTTNDWGQLSTYISYLLTMLYQLFLYCWYGDDLLFEGEGVMLSAYSCGWPDASPSFRNSIKIVMARAQCPLRLTAFKFYTISRETFLMLLSSSYSFFAVLCQVNDPTA